MSKIILEALNDLKNINDGIKIKNKIKEDLSSEDKETLKAAIKELSGDKENISKVADVLIDNVDEKDINKIYDMIEQHAGKVKLNSEQTQQIIDKLPEESKEKARAQGWKTLKDVFDFIDYTPELEENPDVILSICKIAFIIVAIANPGDLFVLDIISLIVACIPNKILAKLFVWFQRLNNPVTAISHFGSKVADDRIKKNVSKAQIKTPTGNNNEEKAVAVEEDFDEDNVSVKDVLKQIVNKFGNKKNKYRLTASSYETSRYYTKTFYAPNDYLALFSMVLHGAPSIANFEDWGQGSDLLYYFNEYPDYLDLLNMASINWWGDGDDYIIALENLTTGKKLYAGDDDYTYSKNDNFDSYDNDYNFEEKLNVEENKIIKKSITEENKGLTKEEQKELGYLKRKERVTPLDKEERYRLMELSKKATNFINKNENYNKKMSVEDYERMTDKEKLTSLLRIEKLMLDEEICTVDEAVETVERTREEDPDYTIYDWYCDMWDYYPEVFISIK